jgi:hypothetical protein
MILRLGYCCIVTLAFLQTLHELITVEYFMQLPRDAQKELIDLLPLCDRMAFERSGNDEAAREKSAHIIDKVCYQTRWQISERPRILC